MRLIPCPPSDLWPSRETRTENPVLEAVSCIPLCDHHPLPLLLWTSYSHVYDDAQGVDSVLVGNLGEGVSGQDVLWEQWESEASQLDCLASLSSAPAQRCYPHKRLGPSGGERSQRVESRCATELLCEAGCGWDQTVGQPRKPRRLSGVWGWNWNFKSLKNWKLLSQIR